ncbi:hypothetical protein Back2_11450 [Nocardioides baekrokdamisoli]|uniref:Integral membrane protein n=1 Tax=Nocardioides baekrokdamisoli TaxID=1804624 RepID=A0A3G9IZS0_9ACTN|nr:hypothetical protein [Nocardioides baekrokdamisoli]BBH16858.1 hypothetical protein Back2_11450 [Nocardioides baekrokdamisoli]
MTSFTTRAARLFSISMLLRLAAAAGLVVDARVHLKLAGAYDSIRSSAVSQGDLFRIEAGLAIAAAVLILLVRKSFTDFFAAAVAGGGLAALLVYRYADLGAIGPLPPMYEPAWYPDKVDTCIAQAIATAASICVLLVAAYRGRKAGRAA